MGDNTLLREFAASRSEAAFAALVRQHMNLVFATAYRQLGNHSLAEEVSQSVFVALARKAGSLGWHPTAAPYFKSPVDNEALARYQLTLTGSLTDAGENHFVKEKAPVDDYDTLFEIGLHSVSVQSVTPEARVVRESLSAYANANHGQMPVKLEPVPILG
jgi:hypothetical protein